METATVGDWEKMHRWLYAEPCTCDEIDLQDDVVCRACGGRGPFYPGSVLRYFTPIELPAEPWAVNVTYVAPEESLDQ